MGVTKKSDVTRMRSLLLLLLQLHLFPLFVGSMCLKPGSYF